MNKRRKYRSLPSRAPPLADHLLRLCRGLRLHSRLRFRFARLGLGLSLGEQPAHLSVSRSKVGVGNQISASRCEVTQYLLLTAARACATLPRTRTISPQLAQASATYLLTRSYLLLPPWQPGLHLTTASACFLLTSLLSHTLATCFLLTRRRASYLLARTILHLGQPRLVLALIDDVTQPQVAAAGGRRRGGTALPRHHGHAEAHLVRVRVRVRGRGGVSKKGRVHQALRPRRGATRRTDRR